MRIDNELSMARLRDIVQDTHLNFLVGAGTPSALFSPLGDIEEVLTQLDTAAVSHIGVRTVARASIYAYFFDNVLSRNIDLLAGTANSLAILSSYQEFLSTVHRILLRRRSSLLNKQVNIFTTNVDLAFEAALETLGLETNDGFAGKIRPQFDTTNFGSLRFRKSSRYDNLSEVPTFNIFKLHGSVGWQSSLKDDANRLPGIEFDAKLRLLHEASDALQSARRYLTQIGDERGSTPINHVFGLAAAATTDLEVDASVSKFMDVYDKFLIVNPNKTKFQTTVMNQTYYELLRIFANDLEKENSTLFVMGFSFRDEHLRQMVLRAASGNPTLQVIVFCFSQADKLEYEKLMPSQLVKNGNIGYIVPPENDDGTSQSLDLTAVTTHFFAPLIPELKTRGAAVDVNITVDGTTVTGTVSDED
jgi:hypothetical protein